MHQNDDDLAVTLKDLHVDETLVDPPVAGIDPLEGTVFSPEEIADVNRHVFEPEMTLLKDIEEISRDGLLTTSHDEPEATPLEIIADEFVRHSKEELFRALLAATQKGEELERQVEFLNRRVNELLAEKDGLARRLDSMNRDLDVLRLAAMRVNDVRLDEAIKERDEAIYHGQQIRKELDAAKKELFEVAIQMKNAAAHARHLVDAIDEFDRELALPHATPYMCITRFLNKARSYSGNTETKQ